MSVTWEAMLMGLRQRGAIVAVGAIAVVAMLGVGPASADWYVDYYLGSDVSDRYSWEYLDLCQLETFRQDIRSQPRWKNTNSYSAVIDAYRFQNRDPYIEQQFQNGDWFGTNSQTEDSNSGWISTYDWSPWVGVVDKRIYADSAYFGEESSVRSDEDAGSGGWHGARCTADHLDTTAYRLKCTYNCW